MAATHLGAALLQLLYQTKTLSTAIFGVIILSKSLRCNQWCALSILVMGVVLAQSSQSAGAASKGNVLIGVSAAIGVSICSGFASVYLEKILKGDTTSIWVRNIQLCIFSIPLQLFAVYQRDYDKVLLLHHFFAPFLSREGEDGCKRAHPLLTGSGKWLVAWLLSNHLGRRLHVCLWRPAGCNCHTFC